MDIKNLRLNYKKSAIDFSNLEDNPVQYFLNWFADALAISKDEANACVLSTISPQNTPASRVVLLKEVNAKGFTFFTNYESDKARDIEKNNHVSLNFYWPELERQVRISGIAKKISAEVSDAYFKNRPRESQLGAWVSNQSKVVDLSHSFAATLDDIEKMFKGKEVDRPIQWGGYCIMPSRVEFWQGRPSRLHDRLVYELNGEIWNKKRLSP